MHRDTFVTSRPGLKIAALILSAISMSVLAVGEPTVMGTAEFNALMKDNSNWGRWGDEDELGTLNFITPAKRKQAATLVQAGITVSLEIELNKSADEWNANPFEHAVTVAERAGHQVVGDKYTVESHGLSHTHMDGLPHFAHQGFFYNGVPYSAAKATGVERLGIENIGINGVFTRGVLVDLPRFYGVDYLQPGYAVTAEDRSVMPTCISRTGRSTIRTGVLHAWLRPMILYQRYRTLPIAGRR